MPEYGDVSYLVTLTIADDAPDPEPSELAEALYQGVASIDSIDAVQVLRDDS